MLADRVQLQQVFVNLIMNAVEAMSSVNEQERQLTLDSNINGAEVSITVTDTGTGIEPGNLDRIFEPFFTTKGEGMGLGLSICRSIVEAHGGRLWASSHKSCGTIVHLTLPLPALQGWEPPVSPPHTICWRLLRRLRDGLLRSVDAWKRCQSPQRSIKSAHRYTHALKRTHVPKNP